VSPRSKGCLAFLFAALISLLPLWPQMAAKAQTPSRVHGTLQTASAPPPFADQIGFFRQVLSKADGDRCPMHPSCSTYALESLNKHGAVMGWIMACDRLLRCGHDEIRLAPRVRTSRGPKTYDPVANNDFWWSPPAPERPNGF
jgi:uncharacterized protein